MKPASRTRITGTDLDVFPICLGTDVFGSDVSERDSFALLDAYRDRGGNFLDTAHIYGCFRPGDESVSEKTIGKWLGERRCRADMVIGTKGAHYDIHTGRKRLTAPDIELDLHESLSYLGVDEIDLYWLHRDDTAIPVEDIVGMMEDHVRKGKIRYYGLSNWQPDRLRAALICANAAGGHLVASQIRWGFATINENPGFHADMAHMDALAHTFHTESGLAQIPYSSQGRGFFSKYLRDGGVSDGMARVYLNAENEKRLAFLQHKAEKTGASVEALALAFFFYRPFVAIPVIGPKCMAHLPPSLDAVSVKLDESDIADFRRFAF